MVFRKPTFIIKNNIPTPEKIGKYRKERNHQ